MSGAVKIANTIALSLVVTILLAATSACADTITSTVAGGPWDESSTWVGGEVPGSYDEVVIAGPVAVVGTVGCLSLTVDYPGSVSGAAYNPTPVLQVSGAVSNAGSLLDGTYQFRLEVGGDLHNAGVWSIHETAITGYADRQLSQEAEAGLTTDLVFADGASGDLIAVTPLTVAGDVIMTGGRLVLQPDCPFTLDEGVFNGELLAGGNEMRFVSWSYLSWCTIDDVVLVGEVEASTAVTFTTRVTVMDVLQNGTIAGGGSAIIEGDLINHGVVQNDQYSFQVRVHGDIENNGIIDVPILELIGVGVEHHLSMSEDAIIDAFVFLPEFQAATLVADTPVRFANGVGLGIGTLVLEPGSSLEFTDWGSVGSGTIEANGNEISVMGSGTIGGLTIDNGVLADQAAISDVILCTNGLTVTGTVTSSQWAAADLTVEGLLRNEGTIQDGNHPIRITALGDVANEGSLINARLAIAGVVDQVIGAGPQGIAVPLVVLESGLMAASYQWYRDGEALSGETGTNLTLATVGPADHGTYHCVADEQTSRLITILESVTTDVPGAAALLGLEQNYPNPFNPQTTIAFSLDKQRDIELVIYDVTGRRLDTLAAGNYVAGDHSVVWFGRDAQGRDLSSGTYIVRMETGGVVKARKLSLIR